MIHLLPVLRQRFIAENKTFHRFNEDDSRKTQPRSLEQQKKQAKELLNDFA